MILFIWPRAGELVTVGRQPWAIAVDPHARHAFVVNNASDTVSMLDTATGTLASTIRVGASPDAIAVDTVRGRALVLNAGTNPSFARGSLSLIDTRKGRVLRTIRMRGQPVAVMCDEVMGRSFVGLSSGVIAIVDTLSGTILTTARAGQIPATMAVDDRLHRLFVTDHTGILRVLNSYNGGVIQTIQAGRALFAGAVDRRTGHLFISDRGTVPGRVLMLDVRTGRLLHAVRIGSGLDPLRIAVDEQLHRVFVMDANATNGAHGAISVLDAGTGHLIGTTVIGQDPSDIAVDPVARRVYAVNAGSSTLSVLDARSGRLVRTIPVMRDPVLIALDASTHRIFVVGFDAPASAALAGTRNPTLLDRLAAMIPTSGSGGTVLTLDTRTLRQ